VFGSPVVEIAIGLVVTYLGLSLVCTALNELIAAYTRGRAIDLERGIRNLLDGTSQFPQRWWQRVFDAHGKGANAKTTPWSDAFFKHQLINALSKDNEKPSYVPSQTFARVLLDLIQTKAAASVPQGGAPPAPLSGLPTFEQIRHIIGQISNARIKEALLPLVDEANSDLSAGISDVKKFVDQVETWYDHAMDRVSGWYKRRTQAVLFVIALVATCLLNVDTVAISRALSRDEPLRKSVVAAAQKLVDNPPENLTGHPATQPVNITSGNQAPATRSFDLDKTTAAVQRSVDRLYQLGIPLGWTATANKGGVKRDDNLRDVFGSWGSAFAKLFGLLVTAFAASLGAPFWFDVLNRFMSVRSAGKAPEERPKEPKEVLQPQSPKATP
jgi:hypothetical protein